MVALKIAELIGATTTVTGFCVTAYLFLRIQVLKSYPFYGGTYGSNALLPGLTYTEGLEAFSLVALSGVILWSYARAGGSSRRRMEIAAGNALLVFGVLVAITVYLETVVAWGQILPGVQVWHGLPGGGGYPWGAERVAYNTCLLLSSAKGDCGFLNYDELFWGALLCAGGGFVLKYKSQ